MNSLTKDLNSQQKEAVYDDSGPLLVIAGPGSGKTHILTRRIARVLSETGGQNFNILALTFTKKAADEMIERIEKLVGNEIERLFISTFHGFCFEVLRKYGSYIGLNKEFTIYEQSPDLNNYAEILIEAVQEEINLGNPDTYQVLTRYTNSQQLRNDAPKLLNAISGLKNRLITPNDIPEDSRKYDEAFRTIYRLYEQKLRTNNVVDFDDLLLLTYRLFTEKPFIAKQYRKVYKHLLIDEAQDTNKAQFEVIKAFTGENYPNIFIVADEDQLIYEWNDARFEYLLEFVKLYNAKTIQMFENYRCPKSVLQMANQLIKLNVNRMATKKDLQANKHNNGNSVVLHHYEYPEDESESITEKIKGIKEYENTCIIARNRFVLEHIEKNLESKNIPFNYPSKAERFLTKEAKVTIALLQAVFNEQDSVHINYLADHYGLQIDDLTNIKDQTLLAGFIEAIEEKEPTLAETLTGFTNKKDDFLSCINKLFKVVYGILPEEEFPDEAKELVDDFEHLQFVKRSYERERDESERSIGDFLSYLALSPKGNPVQNGVTLLTGHAAKGLEFDYVFIVSLNQGVFPDYRSIDKPRALEEERRNFFVAITRTKKKLYLSHTAHTKTRYGYRKQEPSQFLFEIGLL